MSDLSTLDSAILNWNIRNIDSYSGILDEQNGLRVENSCPGEYPSDSWLEVDLTIPRGGYNYDISGRGSAHRHDGCTDVHPKRVVRLPRYSTNSHLNVKQLRTLIDHWKEIGIPEDVPSAAIAIKMSGLTSDYREIQYLNVLLIWNDGAARIMGLECFEGPLEDCISPEWYVQSSKLMKLEDALEEFVRDFSHSSINNISFSISTIPVCLSSNLKGCRLETSPTIWQREIRFDELSMFKSELGLLLTEVRNLFEEEVSK